MDVIPNRNSECGWSGVDKANQLSLGGGGHSAQKCSDACMEKGELCNFAARSSNGYCHLFQTCDGSSGGGWKVYEKSCTTGVTAPMTGALTMAVTLKPADPEYGDVITKDWCKDRRTHKKICSVVKNNYEPCWKAGMDLCNKDSSCFGVMIHPKWTKSNRGVLLCMSDLMQRKGDWKTKMKIPSGGADVDCEVRQAGASDCTASCGTVVVSDVIIPQSGNGAACGQTSYSCKPGDGECPAQEAGLLEYGPVITKEWCKNRSVRKKKCNGQLDDCWTKGIAMCDKESKCQGVMVHPKWTKQNRGFILCTSRVMQRKGDWRTKMKPERSSTMSNEALGSMGIQQLVFLLALVGAATFVFHGAKIVYRSLFRTNKEFQKIPDNTEC